MAGLATTLLIAVFDPLGIRPASDKAKELFGELAAYLGIGVGVVTWLILNFVPDVVRFLRWLGKKF